VQIGLACPTNGSEGGSLYKSPRPASFERPDIRAGTFGIATGVPGLRRRPVVGWRIGIGCGIDLELFDVFPLRLLATALELAVIRHPGQVAAHGLEARPQAAHGQTQDRVGSEAKASAVGGLCSPGS
jgi:hypothetical protein